MIEGPERRFNEWPYTGKPKQRTNTPATREHGGQTKIYRVTNNFETYLTLEPVSREYRQAYIDYCTFNKAMKLKDVRFDVEEITVFCNNARIGRY